MILLISSGFTDKLCKAPDVYQRIRTTLMARVGGTGEEREGGGKEERTGVSKVGGVRRWQ